MVGTTHTEIIHSHTPFTKTRRFEPKISNLDSSDQRTDFHRSNVHCSCFLAQASHFFLLVVVSLQQIDHEVLIHAVSSEQLMLRCVCYLNSEAFIWAAIWGAVNSNELLLCSKGNSRFSFPVAVLTRASFIIELDDFCNCTWRNVKSSWHFPDWLTFMV